MHPIVARRLANALIGLGAAELLMIGATYSTPAIDYLSRADVLPGPAVSISAPPAFERRPLQSFAAFVDRPLFIATRRPPPRAAISPPAPPVSNKKGLFLGRYRLTGIVVTPSVRIAFVTDVSTTKSAALTEGEKLGEWQVVEIKKNAITLQRNSQRETFVLRRLSQGVDSKP